MNGDTRAYAGTTVRSRGSDLGARKCGARQPTCDFFRGSATDEASKAPRSSSSSPTDRPLPRRSRRQSSQSSTCAVIRLSSSSNVHQSSSLEYVTTGRVCRCFCAPHAHCAVPHSFPSERRHVPLGDHAGNKVPLDPL